MRVATGTAREDPPPLPAAIGAARAALDRADRALGRLGDNGVFGLCLAGLALTWLFCFVVPLTPQFAYLNHVPTLHNWVDEGKPQGHVTAYYYATAFTFLFGLWQWRRGRRPSWWLVVGGALLLTALAFAVPPVSSDDIYAYSFYGKVQSLYHANPYLSFPYQRWYDPWFPFWSWRDSGAVYGPPFLLLTKVLAAIAGPSMLTWVLLDKLVLTASIGIGIWLAVAALRAGPAGVARDPRWPDLRWPVFAAGWNPVVLQGVIETGHVDGLEFMLVAGAVLAHRRGLRPLAFLLLLTSAAIKLYLAPLVVLYVLWLVRADRPARAAARAARWLLGGLLLVVAVSLPYASTPSAMFRSALSVSEDYNASSAPNVVRLALGALLPHVTGMSQASADWFAMSAARRLAFAAIAVVFVVVAVRIRRATEPWPAMAAFFLAYLLLTPWVFYWHALPLLALVAVIPWSLTGLVGLVLGVNLAPSAGLVASALPTLAGDLGQLPSSLLGWLTHYAAAVAVGFLVLWWRRRTRERRHQGSATGGRAVPGRPAAAEPEPRVTSTR